MRDSRLTAPNVIRRRAAALAAACAVLAFAAPAAHAADATATTARDAYVKQLDEACSLTNTRLAGAAKDYERHTAVSQRGARTSKTKIGKPADVAEFVRKVAAKEVSDLFSKLKAVSVPSEERAAMTRLFADADKAITFMKTSPDRVAYTDPFAPVAKQFRDLGFASCGHNVSATKPLPAA